jgi:hypothetical protein
MTTSRAPGLQEELVCTQIASSRGSTIEAPAPREAYPIILDDDTEFEDMINALYNVSGGRTTFQADPTTTANGNTFTISEALFDIDPTQLPAESIGVKQLKVRLKGNDDLATADDSYSNILSIELAAIKDGKEVGERFVFINGANQDGTTQPEHIQVADLIAKSLASNRRKQDIKKAEDLIWAIESLAGSEDSDDLAEKYHAPEHDSSPEELANEMATGLYSIVFGQLDRLKRRLNPPVHHVGSRKPEELEDLTSHITWFDEVLATQHWWSEGKDFQLLLSKRTETLTIDSTPGEQYKISHDSLVINNYELIVDKESKEVIGVGSTEELLATIPPYNLRIERSGTEANEGSAAQSVERRAQGLNLAIAEASPAQALQFSKGRINRVESELLRTMATPHQAVELLVDKVTAPKPQGAEKTEGKKEQTTEELHDFLDLQSLLEAHRVLELLNDRFHEDPSLAIAV